MKIRKVQFLFQYVKQIKNLTYYTSLVHFKKDFLYLEKDVGLLLLCLSVENQRGVGLYVARTVYQQLKPKFVRMN